MTAPVNRVPMHPAGHNDGIDAADIDYGQRWLPPLRMRRGVSALGAQPWFVCDVDRGKGRVEMTNRGRRKWFPIGKVLSEWIYFSGHIEGEGEEARGEARKKQERENRIKDKEQTDA